MPRRDAPVRVVGVAMLALLGAHALSHLARGEPHELLWFCNVAGLALGAGCLAGSARVVGPAFLVLCAGTPLWLVDVAQGTPTPLSSWPYHLGGLALGAVAVRRLGLPGFSWLRAVAGAVGCLVAARLATPERFNVNFAFGPWVGWETVFPGHLAFLAAMLAGTGALFALVEAGVRRLAVPSPPPSRAGAQRPSTGSG